VVLISNIHRLYYLWTFVILIACAYNLFIVLFAISLEYDFDAWVYPFDIIFMLIYGFDIFISSRTALNKNFEINVNRKSVLVDYVDSRFFVDLLSIVPLDYILLILSADQQVVAFSRMLRLLKMYKPFDYIRVWRKHSDIK
jgi:hypothetical protein